MDQIPALVDSLHRSYWGEAFRGIEKSSHRMRGAASNFSKPNVYCLYYLSGIWLPNYKCSDITSAVFTYYIAFAVFIYYIISIHMPYMHFSDIISAMPSYYISSLQRIHYKCTKTLSSSKVIQYSL